MVFKTIMTSKMNPLYSGLVVLFFACNLPSSCELDPFLIEKYACQATYWNQYRNALAQYQKVKIEVNKFYYNGTVCQTQCILKAVGKTIQSMDPIQTPNYVPCYAGQGSKLSKQKLVCYNGSCLTIQQIANIINVVTTTSAGLFWEEWDKRNSKQNNLDVENDYEEAPN